MKQGIFILFFLISIPSISQAATIGVMSDGDDNRAAHAIDAMVSDINQLEQQLPFGWDLDAITLAGDISYGTNSSEDMVRAWKNSELADVPLFLVVGNHEIETPEDILFHRNFFYEYSNEFLRPAAQIFQASTTNYSYEIGDLHVSVINQYVTDTSDGGTTDGHIHSDVFDWLKEDLRSATATHKIVIAHEPLYPVQRHIGASIDQNPEERDMFSNLLASYGVVAHIVGHTHFASLTETAFDFHSYKQSVLGGGFWELDTGAFGTKAFEPVNAQGYPTLGYVHTNSDTWGDYEIRLVAADPSWDEARITKRTHDDLARQVLVNTWQSSGTGATKNGLFDMWYWVDYTDTVEENPNWFGNNKGRFWEPEFDPAEAGWSRGELAVGYDDNSNSWGWLNTEIDPDPTQTGENQVWGIFGKVSFQAHHPKRYENLFLDLDWEDSVHVWLNGVHIFNNKTTVSEPELGSGLEYFDKGGKLIERSDVLGKEQNAPRYKRFDISEHLHLLKEGENTLVYMSNNAALDPAKAYLSSDSALAIRLTMEGQRFGLSDEEGASIRTRWMQLWEYLLSTIGGQWIFIISFCVLVGIVVVVKDFYKKIL